MNTNDAIKQVHADLSDGSQQQLAPVEGEAPVPSSNLSVQQNPNEGE